MFQYFRTSPRLVSKGLVSIGEWFCKFHPQSFLIKTSEKGRGFCPICLEHSGLRISSLERFARMKEESK